MRGTAAGHKAAGQSGYHKSNDLHPDPSFDTDLVNTIHVLQPEDFGDAAQGARPVIAHLTLAPSSRGVHLFELRFLL